jgi:hypothetical protein
MKYISRIIFSTALLCTISLHCIAQKIDHTWVYGKDSNNPLVKFTMMKFTSNGLSFETKPYKGAFFYTSTAITNDSSEVILYSNGCSIYNKLGEIMKGGDTINGPVNGYWLSYCNIGYSDLLGIYPIPNPSNEDQFYLIHNKLDLNQTGIFELKYSLVDLKNDGGLGEVIEKDHVLLHGNLERSAAIRHGNGRDWWIIMPDNYAPIFNRFLLNDTGISGPFEQVENSKMTDSSAMNQVIRFTPDGSKLVRYHSRLGFWIYDFDRCTGLVSNPTSILFQYKPLNQYRGWDFAISPNSRYLYIVLDDFTKLVQYDMASSQVDMTGDTVAVYDGFYSYSQPTVFGSMSLSPDGKIYITPGGCPLMHVINNPDLPGAACNVVQRGIQLPTWNYFSMPYFPNYRLYDLPASPCDTLGIDTPISTIQQPDIPLLEGLLYPNPALEQASLYLPGWQGTGRVTITDALGRVVLEQVVSRDRTTFQVRNWPSGVYAVLVWKEGRLVAAEQLVVQRN